MVQVQAVMLRLFLRLMRHMRMLKIQDGDAYHRSYGILPEVRLNKILIPYNKLLKII